MIQAFGRRKKELKIFIFDKTKLCLGRELVLASQLGQTAIFLHVLHLLHKLKNLLLY